jgi:hypothetical protein
MSLFSDIGDAVSSAAKTVAHVAEDAVSVAGNVAADMAKSTIDGIKDTFDSPMSVLKGVAFATVLAPLSMALTAYELGSDVYKETDNKIQERKNEG